MKQARIANPCSSDCEWRGGWAGDAHFTQLAACANAQGTACTTLTDMHYPSRCANGAAVLDPAFTGDYLRVADQLVGPNPVQAKQP